jgi:hypothetical protein
VPILFSRRREVLLLLPSKGDHLLLLCIPWKVLLLEAVVVNRFLSATNAVVGEEDSHHRHVVVEGSSAPSKWTLARGFDLGGRMAGRDSALDLDSILDRI